MLTTMTKFFFLLLSLFSLLSYSQIQIGEDIDGETINDLSGSSVSMSSNGSIVAIGAEQNSDANFISGHVRVFENQNGNWVQIGEDIDGEGEFDKAGESVSISSNGSVVAVGAPGNDGAGHIRVFENQNGEWIQIGQEIQGLNIGDSFGISTSLSANGTIVAIGARQQDITLPGYAQVFENQNGSWQQIGQNIVGDAGGDDFGINISISNDGNILAIGATENGGDDLGSGYVRIFENQNNTWTQIGQDILGTAVSDIFGSGISISGDGTIVAIGAPRNDDNGNSSGNVQVFENQNGTWVQIGEDILGEEGDIFGSSVSISDSGNILAVGAPFNSGNGSSSGVTRIYQNQNDTWIQIGQDIFGEDSNDISGAAVSISGDSSTLVIGAPFNSDNGDSAGHVRIFNLSDLLSVETEVINKFKLFPNPATSILNIELKQNAILENINIYNSLGQRVQNSKILTIDISNLSSGIYVVEVITTKEKSLQKLIIN